MLYFGGARYGNVVVNATVRRDVVGAERQREWLADRLRRVEQVAEHRGQRDVDHVVGELATAVPPLASAQLN